VSPDSIAGTRGDPAVREAFQSYPSLLIQDGDIPRLLREAGLGADLEHRDTRLALGLDRGGRLLSRSRFEALGGALSNLPLSFSPSQSLIMDVINHKVLWAHPIDGRPPYQVYQFADPDVRIDYPRWSPDGRWVMFDRVAPRGGDLWALEGF
jgi:hypothetical protein